METSDEPVTTAAAVQPEAGLDRLLPVPVCTLVQNHFRIETNKIYVQKFLK